VVEATGTVTAFGDAKSYGSAPISAWPVVGIASTLDGHGYWIVYQNGEVYPLGDAANLPQLTEFPSAPIVSLVPTSDDLGYWLIGADGNVYNQGDAPAQGTLPGFNPPVIVNNVVGGVPTALG
jgi:hypothetical protein